MRKYQPEDISERTILRDFVSKDEAEYIDKTHERLCDIADTLYNAHIPSDSLRVEYKFLYDAYDYGGFWEYVLKDMSAIDSQMSNNESRVSELKASYKDRVNVYK